MNCDRRTSHSRSIESRDVQRRHHEVEDPEVVDGLSYASSPDKDTQAFEEYSGHRELRRSIESELLRIAYRL